MVSQTSPVGIRLDFDLYKSIQVDGSGQITGEVTPTLNIKAVGPSDPGGYIDEFDVAVVSVDVDDGHPAAPTRLKDGAATAGNPGLKRQPAAPLELLPMPTLPHLTPGKTTPQGAQ